MKTQVAMFSPLKLTTISLLDVDVTVLTSESLKDLMRLGTTWYQLQSCRGHGSYYLS